MEFSLKNELSALKECWRYVRESDLDIEKYYDSSIYICGPKGSGKTRIAQEFVRSNKYVYYISFVRMSTKEALESFIQMHLSDGEGILTWQEAADRFVQERRNHHCLLIFEDEDNEAQAECRRCFRTYVETDQMIKSCYITCEKKITVSRTVNVRYRTLRDFRETFPLYRRQDTVRLYAMTGGMMSIAKELDKEKTYEENLQVLLRYDSAFSVLLPAMLNKCFRTPESYVPILRSMAVGNCRLSEIAKDVGFANNKCLNYMDALIANGFVVSEKTESGKQSTYHLANSYYTAWCRYAAGRGMLQITDPERFAAIISEEIDERIAMPAFRDACMRLIDQGIMRSFGLIQKTEKNVAGKSRDGREMILDYIITTKQKTLYFIFPKSLDYTYLSDELERCFQAIEKFQPVYDAEVFFFCVHRYSNRCVSLAGVHEWLHLATIDSLSY